MGEIVEFPADKVTVCPVCMLLVRLKANPLTDIEREQWISGICSDICWNLLLGPEN